MLGAYTYPLKTTQKDIFGFMSLGVILCKSLRARALYFSIKTLVRVLEFTRRFLMVVKSLNSFYFQGNEHEI